MNLTVVRKIILGFAIISAMLLVTNVVSYLGLGDISQSAQSVVNEKMPVQEKMLQVEVGMLSLAKESTRGFFIADLDSLRENHDKFSQLAAAVEQQLVELGQLLDTDNAAFLEGRENATIYLDNSKKMYLNRIEQLKTSKKVQTLVTEMIGHADEASALLQDLSYMESKAANFDRLVGTGNNIDNKITPMINGIKEFIKILDANTNTTERENIEFSISNADVDVNYLNRLAQDINTDGLVDEFNNQYQQFVQGYAGNEGLFALQQTRIDKHAAAQQQQDLANQSLEQAITALATLFEQVNQSTLDGQNYILSVVQTNIWRGVAIMVMTLAMVFAVGMWVTRSIAIPLARINRSLNVLGSGDLTHKARVIGDDEFALLATSVNQLSASLHGVVEQIHDKEKLLSDAVHFSVDLGEKNLSKVALQRQQVIETSEHTNVVHETSLSNLQQINQSTEQMQMVAKQSELVAQLVAKTKHQVLEQAQQSAVSSKIIHRLDENSKNIVSILDVIKSIAEQTNLLALNAAIEAARAGEQGRGFAVVADEVRNLATKTQASTAEIENVISTLHKDAEQAVKAMEIDSAQSNESVGLIEKVTDEVMSITRVIEQLSSINKKIATDTNLQDQLLNTVVNNLQTIVDISEQSAQSTSESNHAIAQISVLNEELKGVVASFKL
ncbi:MAG: HAMP domain-containing protein [Paraglaciecola sp.]|nr:HAMP domain-containing protein [Paraglaciecola sp.]NCT47205.1 HAMP domain-containing protein [Paraglaciecola sp.]